MTTTPEEQRPPRRARESPAAAGAVTTSAPQNPFDVSWPERTAVLGGVAFLLAAALGLGWIRRPEAVVELAALIPASLFAVGKFLPLWGITGKSQLGPYELGAIIGILDTLSVLVIVYALEGIYRIRRLARALDRVQESADLVLTAYPSMRRAATVGVVAFVLFPIAGTGAVGATFIGILLGMHRVRLALAVSTGGFVGGMGMAVAAVHFREQVLELRALQEQPELKYAIVGGAVAVVAAFLWWANTVYRRALAAAREAPVAPGGDPS